MYSDKFKWDSVRNYYQQQSSSSLSSGAGKRRHSNASSSRSSNGGGSGNQGQQIRQAIGAVVQRSGVLGVKREKQEHGTAGGDGQAALMENKDQTRPSSSTSSVTLLENVAHNKGQFLDADPANSLLPTFDQLANLPPAIQCRKFFEDVQPLDRILVRIVRTGVAVLHVEPVCMLTRFRRNLLPFMRGKLLPVAFERTKRFYQVNDYVSTTVVALSPNSAELELQLDEEEAIFTEQGIPAYCRHFAPTTFDDSRHIARLRDNPNLALQLGIQINSQHTALSALAGRHLHLAPSPEQLRREQTARLAMTHVVRGAELTRENKCFEAIQCFNKALAVYPECADAFVGRGAAAAGSRNFVSALADFDRAVELQPGHRNANKYRLEVLMAFGRDLEKAGDLAEARSKFERILALQPDHQQAREALARISQAEQPELVDLSDEEETSRNGFGQSMTEEEARRNREKLAEMEEFIRKLKGK